MISPELLRRYPFFSGLNDSQQKKLAMVGEEATVEKGAVIFEECDEATHLYFLLSGSVDLYYRSEEEFYPKTRKDFHIGEINPGEVFGISALFEPYNLNATARADQASTLIRFDAKSLRQLMDDDLSLGYRIMLNAAKALMERLGATRVQLAAAWASH
jgi:CRP-like cAMP-binding protein